MKSRDFYPSFFKDSFIVGLTPAEKMLYICYHFTKDVDLLFCFSYPDREALHESGATIGDLTDFKQKAEAANKIRFNGDYVYLVNAHRFETLKGERIETGRRAAFSRLPTHIQDWFNQVSSHPITLVDDAPILKSPEVAKIIKEKSAPKPENNPKYLIEMTDEVATKFADKYDQTLEVVKQQAFKCGMNHTSKKNNNNIVDWNKAFHTWMTNGYDLNKSDSSEVPFTDLSHLGQARVERRNY